MGTLTVSIVSTPITGSKSYTISDVDAARFLTWVRAVYPTVAGPDDAYGNPTTVPATALQSLARWADGFMAGTAANITNHYWTAAAKTAQSAITAIAIY